MSEALARPLSVVEMQAAGFAKNASGYWMTCGEGQRIVKRRAQGSGMALRPLAPGLLDDLGAEVWSSSAPSLAPENVAGT